jgi:uncharacterized membrane protein YtjA (UPF0391 family)
MMFYAALAFLLLAIIMAILSFGGILTGAALSLGMIGFFLFLVLFLVSLVMGLGRQGSTDF